MESRRLRNALYAGMGDRLVFCSVHKSLPALSGDEGSLAGKLQPTSMAAKRRSAILPWWWFFWLVGRVLGQVSFRMRLSAKVIPDFTTADVLAEFADCVGIALACLALVLVGRITRMQLNQKLASSLD